VPYEAPARPCEPDNEDRAARSVHQTRAALSTHVERRFFRRDTETSLLTLYDLWLDPSFTDIAAAFEMLKPYDAAAMRAYAVSSQVSNVANDDAECEAPVEVAQEQARLF
jgi:hypothetical protein